MGECRWSMSYGANRVEPYRRVTVYVDKILKGAKPADLPVEQPMKFEFVINLKAAKATQLDDSTVGAVPSGQGHQMSKGGECRVSSDEWREQKRHEEKNHGPYS